MRRITIYRVLAVLALVAFFAFVFALSSCGTAKTIVKEGEVRTEYVDRFREHRDSIYLHDSVYIHSKGDTVYQSVGTPAFEIARCETPYIFKK